MDSTNKRLITLQSNNKRIENNNQTENFNLYFIWSWSKKDYKKGIKYSFHLLQKKMKKKLNLYLR